MALPGFAMRAAYRGSLRAARGFSDPAFKAYFFRRTKETFREHAAAPAASDQDFLADMKKREAVMKRQVIVHNMYHEDDIVVNR
jgi:hypothetical protein